MSTEPAAAAMGAYARALRAYRDGDAEATLLVVRDDGLEVPLPVRHFFRGEAELTALEREALARCTGRVLDAAAGTGGHTLLLQQRGLQVTAVDVAPEAVAIMVERGVRDARCADLWTFGGSGYDTMLLLGHGIGIAGNLAGLDRFLEHARTLLVRGGALLLDSLDVTRTTNPRHRAYHEANRRAERYVGETRFRFEYAGERSAFCAWLHVDPVMLRHRARAGGWDCETLRLEPGGEYLARLEAR